MPSFVVPDDSTDFAPEERDTVRARLLEGFNDMLKMAALACATFNEDEAVYLRYFGEASGDVEGLVHCESRWDFEELSAN